MPRFSPMKTSLCILLFVLFSSTSYAKNSLAGASFIGLTKAGWRLFLIKDNKVEMLDDIEEPRQAVWSSKENKIAYVDLEGDLHERVISSGVDTVLVSYDDRHAYTQIRYFSGDLWAVRLFERKSIVTQLVRWNASNREFEIANKIRGSSHDPMPVGDNLYYTFVSCAQGCGKVIQDVWEKHRISGEANQLTRLNSISRQPVPYRNDSIVFSTKQNNFYNLWVYENGIAKALTKGSFTDSDPVVSKNNNLFFIRRENGKGSLMMWDEKKSLAEKVPSSVNIMDVRNLEYEK